jgi:hypothetical protein
MKENVQIEKAVTPMLFPFDPDQFWQRVRLIIREEVTNAEKSRPAQPAQYENHDSSMNAVKGKHTSEVRIP